MSTIGIDLFRSITKNISGQRKVFFMQFLTNWFARKNVDDTVIFVTIFITGTNQVHSITNNIVPLQSGSVFYKRAIADWRAI